MDGIDELATSIKSRYEALRSEQSNFRSEWQDCSDYILPRKGNIETKRSPGEKQTTQIFDTTARQALNVFAAGLVSQLTPAGEIWARYTAPKDAPQEEKDWMDECTQVVLHAIYGSNFYQAWHEDCIDGGCFASSLMFADESESRVFNFVNIPVGSFVWCENAEGEIDTIYRCFKWTARQCVQKWGIENMPDKIKEAYEQEGGKDRKFEIIHAVYPREKGEYMDGPTAPNKRPWASVFVIECGPKVIENGGYYEKPFMAGRLERSNGEVYGRGPGIQTLPEIKLLNRMEKDILIGLEKMVNPPWLMPDTAAYRADSRPDGTTYWDSSDPNNKPEQVQLQNRVDLGESKSAQKRDVIREAFYNSMFQMLTSMDEMKREKTAYEVAQMLQEKLVLFSPIFARMVQEKLNPLMERAFAICARRGMLPPPPPSVVESGGVFNYDIEYNSTIALAIRAAVNNSIVLLVEIVNSMAPFDPSVVHVVKWREAFRTAAENRGIPAKLIRTDEEIDALMQQQAEAMAAQAAPENADKLASAAQKVGAEGMVRDAMGG